MRRIRRSLIVLVAVVGLFPAMAFSQVKTGMPPFGSFTGGPDTINEANLNIHWHFPIISKPGRGLPFNYALRFDNSVWNVVYINGHNTWQPINNTQGWVRQTEALTGYMTYDAGNSTCGPFYENWTYHDPSGTAHMLFDGRAVSPSGCNGPTSITGPATDGSGYQVTVTAAPSATVYAPSGVAIQPPLQNQTGPAQITDANGNFISTSDGRSFVDTTGATVLTLADNGGGVAFPTSFTYTAPGGSKTITVGYTGYNVQTNFGCTGITEYGPSFIPLLTSITYPDGSSYQISYEDTPGFAGSKTGRISQVTLPTGGSISYSYSGGSNGRGLYCDGATAGFTRTINDGSNNFQQTYSVTENVDGTSTTDVKAYTGPNYDETIVNFSGGYETQRKIYQGPASGGTLKETVLTCYNNDPNCSAASTVSAPITARDVRTTLDSVTGRVQTTYDPGGRGLPIETDNYDFITGSTWGNPVKKTFISYASTLGNIVDRPWSVTIKDGNNNVLADTEYRYDEYGLGDTSANNPAVPQHGNPPQPQRGNLTTISQLVAGTTYLAKHFSYYDTGTPSSAQDVNGQNTIYNYDPAFSCGYSYITSVTAPITSLVNYVGWNCDGGVTISTIDANGQTASLAYNDPNFWRPTSVTDPLNNVTNANYASRTLTESGMWFNNNNSFTDAITTLDGLGRPHIAQRRQGPGSLLNIFDSAEIDYDSYGRPSRSTAGYVATSIGQTSSNTSATTTTYDALSRPTFVQTRDAQGTVLSTVQSVYVANDVCVQSQPRAADGTMPTRQYEYDGLGRLTSVCEITNGPGSGTCGQTNPQTGYWTRYFYDAAGHLMGVIQNAQASAGSQQTRNFFYDGLGRMTSQTDPETGLTQFVYDADAGCGITSTGDLVRRVDNAGNVTCYQYDALHRNTVITYAGPNAGGMPAEYLVYDSAIVNGQAMANAKGRLARAYTCTACTPTPQTITDLGFSYSARGETTDVYESTLHSGGFYHIGETYWNHGLPGIVTGMPGMPYVVYGSLDGTGLDGEGRITKVTAGTGQNPVTGVTYNNNGTSQPIGVLTQVNFGSGDYDQFNSDPNTGRLTQYVFHVNGFTDTGNLTWNGSGSLYQLQIADNVPGTSDTQTCYYTHDDLERIASVNCDAGWAQNFTYDPFGNITKSGSVSFQSTYSAATNRITKPGFVYDNGATNGNGNITQDDAGNAYTWDAAGKMISVTSGGSTVNLTYDALGRMVEQQRGVNYGQIVYGPNGDKLALMNGQTLSKAFVPLPGGATAVYNASGLQYYRHSDWLGSSRLASTATVPTQRYYAGAYAPFGEPYAESGATDRSFTGQNQDTVFGLYDFMFREQTPIQGRWLSPDPAGPAAVDIENPQSWNRYSYALNNPCEFTDPLGLTPCTIYVSGPNMGANAQAEASKIFSHAGVNLVFNTDPGAKADFTFQNADLSSLGTAAGAGHPARVVLGNASLPVIREDFSAISNGAMAYVHPFTFTYAVDLNAQRAVRAAYDLATGRVLAHEIGHKFLGPHDARGRVMGEDVGIMSIGMEDTSDLPFAQGSVEFTKKQAAMIRTLCDKLRSPVKNNPPGHGGRGAGDIARDGSGGFDGSDFFFSPGLFGLMGLMGGMGLIEDITHRFSKKFMPPLR